MYGGCKGKNIKMQYESYYTAYTFQNITLNERISVSFRDKITFESALESSEYILFDENNFRK